MPSDSLSRCPISFTLDHIGDRWSLLILRDILFSDKQYYDEFAASPEGISTNILANRLKQLESSDMITRRQDEDNRRRFVYRPTEKALDLLPVIIEMIRWGARHDPDSAAPPEVTAGIRKDAEGFARAVRAKFPGTRADVRAG
jgi:DNA-binding HxlR family transcriptional regulator